MNDVQRHQRRKFVDKLLGAYTINENPHIIALADAYVDGRESIDNLWREIREDAP